MSWGKLLQPDLILGGSILNLTPKILQAHNLQGLVLDVDETLVPITSADACPDLQSWIEQVKSITKIWLVSNNISQDRIRRIGESLDVPYIAGAAKPSGRKLKRAVDDMNLPVDNVAMVGDRLFTDVLAGNRLGMFTILVEPMVHVGDELRTYHTRNIEVWISQLLGVTLSHYQADHSQDPHN
jgi:HAD superfamily phosphatase (TIGR01668 family)